MKNIQLHPLYLLEKWWSFLKNSFFLIVLLFVINYGTTSPFISTLQKLFILWMIYSIIRPVIVWKTTTFKITDEDVTIERGLFNRKKKSVPFDRVQHIQRNTNWIYRPFQLTSLTLTTSASEDGEIEIPSLTVEEADFIERAFRREKTVVPTEEQSFIDEAQSDIIEASNDNQQKTYFQTTKKDVFKATILSFQFLAIFPLLLFIYNKISGFSWAKTIDAIGVWLWNHPFLLVGAIVIAFLLSFFIGWITTYLRYGHFIITADDTYIYVEKGVLSRQRFSIPRERVQAIEINQSFGKRLLGLTSIKLISSSHASEELQSSQELYPFLPVKVTDQLLEQLLPHFSNIEKANRLPRRVLALRMLKIPWFTLLVAAALYYFEKPIAFALIVLVITYLLRILDFYRTRFATDGERVMYKSGALSTSTVITTRRYIVQVEKEHSIFQQLFGVTSITFYNRQYTQTLHDVPTHFAHQFIDWYKKRAVATKKISQMPYKEEIVSEEKN